ncbi:hypothetical protein [Hominisplanchenecus murintestinalis]|uniref:hypothetical protein n=1 Tax=Hominisplanchenecus murintestinalis TaxID=2941517 RepID=UPI00203DC303|nr:hypothetical protein [Hominisplanchenecus murintestinalis]
MIHVSVAGFAMVMEVLGLVFGVLGAFVIFFVFMSRKNEKRFTGRLARMYDFLNFRLCIIEDVLKFCYVLAACLCTGIGLFMSLSVVELTRGLVLLVGGNLAVRIVFEFIMILLRACRNLGELGKNTETPVYAQKEPIIQFHMEEAAAASEGKEPVAVHSKKTAAGKEISAGREKYKVCPSCGEKCSNRFAFCNMCGTKLS